MSKAFLLKKTLFILFITLSAFAQEPSAALGFRIGEPLGLNIRKYFNNNTAFDVNIGTFGFLIKQSVAYRKGRYETPGVAFQGHYLKTYQPSDKFLLYAGFGGEINNRLYRNENNIPTKKYSFGPSATAGLEFFIPNDKISVFLDGGGYLELLPSPLFFNPNIGIGVRYNFFK